MLLTVNLFLILCIVLVGVRYNWRVTTIITMLCCAISIVLGKTAPSSEVFFLQNRVMQYFPSAIFLAVHILISYESTRLRSILITQENRYDELEANSNQLLENFHEIKKAHEELERRILKDDSFYLRWLATSQSILQAEGEEAFTEYFHSVCSHCRLEAAGLYLMKEGTFLEVESTHKGVYDSAYDPNHSLVRWASRGEILSPRNCPDLRDFKAILLKPIVLSQELIGFILVRKMDFHDLNLPNLKILDALTKTLLLKVGEGYGQSIRVLKPIQLKNLLRFELRSLEPAQQMTVFKVSLPSEQSLSKQAFQKLCTSFPPGTKYYQIEQLGNILYFQIKSISKERAEELYVRLVEQNPSEVHFEYFEFNSDSVEFDSMLPGEMS